MAGAPAEGTDERDGAGLRRGRAEGGGAGAATRSLGRRGGWVPGSGRRPCSEVRTPRPPAPASQTPPHHLEGLCGIPGPTPRPRPSPLPLPAAISPSLRLPASAPSLLAPSLVAAGAALRCPARPAPPCPPPAALLPRSPPSSVPCPRVGPESPGNWTLSQNGRCSTRALAWGGGSVRRREAERGQN